MKSMHECPCCTCGQIELSWSDRAAHVYPNGADGIVNAIVSCALDHSYDRTKNGVPYGLPREIEDEAAIIVEKHLSAVNPNWKAHTVDMSHEQKKVFREELLSKVRDILKSN